MKQLMMLGAGPLQVPAIRKAKELGFRVIAVDYDKNAPGFQYADRCLPVSTMDVEGVCREALLLRPDLVMTSTSDGPVYTVACVNQKLGRTFGLSPEDALCATNKAKMRERLREYDVPIPEFYVVENQSEYREALSHFSGRCVVKPADNAGSRGVRLFNNKDGGAEEIYEYSRRFSRSGTVLVEEYLTGPEVSVESFSVGGVTTVVAITDKLVTQPPFFTEIGHSEPSHLDKNIQNSIQKITKKAIQAIHIRGGPSHTEIKITGEGPKVVEIAARLGGDFITSRLVPLSTGVDLVGNSIRLEAGLPVDLSAKFQKGAAIRYLTAKGGILKRISGAEEAAKRKGVEEIILYKKEGDRVHGPESSDERIGHIIASADTADAAAAICEAAKASIKMETTTL